MACGFIKIYRSLTEKAFYRDSEYVHLWLHLLMKASFCNSKFMFGGQTLTIGAGELLAGRKMLSVETGIEESKVERILDYFEKEKQIEQIKTNKFRIIRIVNWADYQLSGESKQTRTRKEKRGDEKPKPENDEQKISKEKEKEKEKKMKNVYCGNVYLTDDELNKVKLKYGDEMTMKAIEYLSSYKIEKDYKTKSDYLTILRWVVNAVQKKEREEKLINGKASSFSRSNAVGEGILDEQERILARARERLQEK